MQSLEFDGKEQAFNLDDVDQLKADAAAAEEEAKNSIAALQADPVADNKGFTGVGVKIEIDWNYRMVVLKTSTGDTINLTLIGARALALSLRQAANQIERAGGRKL